MLLKRFFLFFLLGTPLWVSGWPFFFGEDPSQPEVKKSIIVIDPAGDSSYEGREIEDTFERSLTLRCGQAIKEHFERAEVPTTRVFLTRYPGEMVEPLQNISFSNRLNADLYVSLHFFKTERAKPELFIYTYSLDPAVDSIEKKFTTLSLLPYDQAYKVSFKKTQELSKLFYQSLLQSSVAHCHAPVAFPFKPLLGITAPALGLEIGLSKESQIASLISLITHALESVLQ